MATYYVDPLNGSDSNNGSSIALAFKSTAKSETVVAAGDTVKLLATATEMLTGANTITLATSGGLLSSITWQGCDASAVPLPSGRYYTIDGSGMNSNTDIVNTAAITNRSFNNVRFTNSKRFGLSCTTDPAYTIQLSSCSIIAPVTACLGSVASYVGYGFICVACVFTGSGSSGSQSVSRCLGGGGYRSEIVLLGCVVSGFNSVLQSNWTNGASFSVQGNVFANNGAVLSVFNNAGSAYVTGNVFYANVTAINLGTGGSNRLLNIANNTFVNNGVALTSGAANIVTVLNAWNHYYNNTNDYAGGASQGQNEIRGVDPLFNSPGVLDFRLKSGSPLIGAGPGGINIAGLSQIGGGGGGVPLMGEGLVF